MIDLEALKRSAESTDGESAVVSRRFLQQALQEITAGRAAQARVGQCFGLPDGETL